MAHVLLWLSIHTTLTHSSTNICGPSFICIRPLTCHYVSKFAFLYSSAVTSRSQTGYTSIPMAMWSQSYVCGRLIVGTGLDSPWGYRRSCLVVVICCVGSGLCEELISHTQKSYRVFVFVSVLDSSTVRLPGLYRYKKKIEYSIRV
jgi:hypothetical protein